MTFKMKGPTFFNKKSPMKRETAQSRKDKKDPNSDRFYPEVAKIAKTKSMARQIKHQEVLKTGKKVRVKHNDPKTY